jgi:hypothetical protein
MKANVRKYKELLLNWYWKQECLPRPDNPALFKRVFEAIRLNVVDEHSLSSLYIETKGGKPKRQRGRPTSAERDAKIAAEYDAGLKHKPPLWRKQTEYLQKRHAKKYEANPNSTKSWLSQLLKRADKASNKPRC